MISTGTITDVVGKPGVYLVTYIPIKAGTFKLNVLIESLEIQGSPFEITVSS